MESIFTPCIEKQKGGVKEEFKATLIVTPAKLINPGHPMMKLYEADEYAVACRILEEIISEIKTESGVDLFYKTKLYRVDITKDIETPSDAHTQEIIRLAKSSFGKYGYDLLNLNSLEYINKEWDEENSILFHNDEQDVQAKLYNKRDDLKNNGYDIENIQGLLRFEVALKRKFMKTKGFITEKYITIEELSDVLGSILEQASELMQKYITSPLGNGDMLAKEHQKKRIQQYCDYNMKSAKYEKIMAYRRACNRAVSIKNIKKNRTVDRYFHDMKLSPLYASDEVGDIPSFMELLTEAYPKW